MFQFSTWFFAGLFALSLVNDSSAKILFNGDYEQTSGWRFTSDASATGSGYFLGTGSYTFTLGASGTAANGVYPHIDFKIDGQSVGTFTLGSSELKKYSLTVPVTSGTHVLGLSFANDMQTATEDRNVTLTSLRIEAPANNLAIPACLQVADMTHAKGFSSPNFLYQYGATEVGTSYGVQLEHQIVRAGKSSNRIELRLNDPMVANGMRAEIDPNINGLVGHPSVHDERWYGFSVYLPADWQNDIPTSPDLVFQVHERPDTDCPVAEEWRSPPLSLRVIDDHWAINKIWNDVHCTTGGGVKAGHPITYALGAYTKGAWTDFVIHVKWSFQDTPELLNSISSDPEAGLVEIWINGNKVLTNYGPNYYNDSHEGFIKYGLYKATWDGHQVKAGQPTTRILYNDELRVGDIGSSFDEVNPAQNGAIPETGVIEAENMTIHKDNASVAAIPGGGKARKLGSRSWIGQNITFDSTGLRQFNVKAYSTIANGAWPQMQLLIDQVPVQTIVISSATDASFQYQVPITAGTHEVGFAFLNDYYSASQKEDRNLFIDSLQILKK